MVYLLIALIVSAFTNAEPDQSRDPGRGVPFRHVPDPFDVDILRKHSPWSLREALGPRTGGRLPTKERLDEV